MSARPRDGARARVLALALALAGCAVGPSYQRPAVPTDKAYVAGQRTARTTPSASGVAQRIDESNALPPDWWRLFRSGPLTAIVTDAIANNPSLEAAEAALRRSQDELSAGFGVFFPQLDAGASAARQRFSPKRFGSMQPSTVFNLFTLSASVSYALDIWGGQRRALEGLSALVDAQRASLAGARIVLAGNVVNTLVAIAAYRAEIEATTELIALEQDQVELSEAQAKAGTLPYASLYTLAAQVAATRATLPPLEKRIDQSEHLLATLVGRSPAAWRPPAVAFDQITLPADVPVSLPAELVRQRPDVLIAEAQLHAATAQIGVATAAMLPNLTLTGNVGVNSTTVGDLLSKNNLFWSAGAGLTQPLFQGGTNYYQRRAAIDARDQALASYRQVVLSALAQVADDLRGLEHDARAVTAESEALEAAEGAFRLLRIGYQSGLANYLQVLTANAQYLRSRIALIEAKSQRLQDTVALFVALGGGWWNAPPS